MVDYEARIEDSPKAEVTGSNPVGCAKLHNKINYLINTKYEGILLNFSRKQYGSRKNPNLSTLFH